MPPDQQQELWGENFDKNYQKLKSCVEATAGETLLYNGTYIYAAYHAISSGRTRSMSELYEDADMPNCSNIIVCYNIDLPFWRRDYP